MPRTIPTHVGRTRRGGASRMSHPDHPHARGENPVVTISKCGTVGPSPRTWGERFDDGLLAGEFRTIPTHVGRTHVGTSCSAWIADHPHARGENVSRGAFWAASIGPSPRTWGERSEAAVRAFNLRTIPTHVGRTNQASANKRHAPDHPHARGENGRPEGFPDEPGGPSPRTWGEPDTILIWPTMWRTIPTHVGRTPRPWTGLTATADHPHARGENSIPPENYPGNHGPSPRTWGERRPERNRAAIHRTIPTHVGRTRRRIQVILIIKDHPHARGENPSASS